MKSTRNALLFISFVLILTIGVQAKDVYTFSHSQLNTSSFYHSKVFDLSAHALDGGLQIGLKKSDGYVQHEDFSVRSVTLGHRFNNFKSKPSLKLGYFSRTFVNQSVAVGLIQIQGDESTNEKFNYSYQLGYVPMSEEFQTAYTVREILRGGNITFGGSYRWGDRWRSTFFLQHFSFNDNNTRSNDDLGLLYGIAPGDPWFWVGIGASRMSNTNTKLPYWVPLEFYTLGPRFDLAFSLGEKFKFVSGLNLNYFKDVRVGEGRGYYSMTKLTYKVSPTLDFFTGLESIQSQQLGRTWKSSDLSLGISGSW